ncbi:putative repeat protein (TIGR01451 family) [Sphingomonas sp. PvP055]
MRRMMAGLAALGVAILPAAARADPLTVTKTAAVVSDQISTVAPKALPGATVDYRVLFSNPSGNLLTPVRNITIDDVLPTRVVLRVADIAAAGKGPVEFLDGSLLGLGLGGSGLSCGFTSYASTTDCIDFSDGTSWSYVPSPDADGYDARVRAIRVKPVTTFATNGSFQIRYRVKIQ